MKASDLFIKSLENEGVRYIFGVPGEENLDLLESIRKSGIKMVTTRHEQAAGFMAATIGRLTGKPGVALSTLGPGATNFVTASAYAQLGGMPMMMITGQKPIKKNKQGGFQIVDTVEILGEVTKFNRQIINANSIPFLVREAFKQAEGERPGAVHLELPEDIAAEQAETDIVPIKKIRRPVAEAKAIKEAVEMISAAKRPLLLIGAGANRKLTSKMLTQLVDKTGIYFFNTQMGKGVISENHAAFLGTAALSSGDYIHCAVEQADLIINVGHDVIEKPPFIMKRGGTRVIHINFSPASVNEIYFPQHEVVGDIANAIWQIHEQLSPQKHWDFYYYAKIKKQLAESVADRASDNHFPVLPQRVVTDVRQAMPDDGIVCLDNGMYKLWFARNYQAMMPNTLLLDNALATMGAGLPSAMAAKLISPDKRVVAICGDGGFMMSAQEMETAIRLKIDLTVLILNDNGYGMIKWKQKGMNLPNFGLDFGNPDFVKLAECFGAKGYRVAKTADLSKLLKSCLASKGLHVIEVPVDYSENDRFFNQELKAKTCPV